MKTSQRNDEDRRIKQAVEDELDWVPELDPANVGVSVIEGVLVLSGEVRSYSERVIANEAALRVHGVLTVVDALETRSSATMGHDDIELAKTVRETLIADSRVPSSAIQVTVRGGVVALTGGVQWNYQRESAQRAIAHIEGVRGISNELRLTSRPSAADAQQRIESALLRAALLDAKAINVTVDGNVATLTGVVHSAEERRRAEEAAWSSPHIVDIRNDITVDW
jgi:osmotically-inducible protein OsmY